MEISELVFRCTVFKFFLVSIFSCASGIISYFTVWILSLIIFYGGASNAAPAPRPGEDNMLGEYGDLFGTGKKTPYRVFVRAGAISRYVESCQRLDAQTLYIQGLG